MKGHVLLLTVWCGECSDEGRSRPGRVGQVERHRSGVIGWRVEDRRGVAKLGGRDQRLVGWQVLKHPTRSDYRPPEELPALCERHGWGRVSGATTNGPHPIAGAGPSLCGSACGRGHRSLQRVVGACDRHRMAVVEVAARAGRTLRRGKVTGGP